jgi:two-component system LytT family response regulator
LEANSAPPSSCRRIEANGNYAIVHVDNRNHLLRRTMSALEAALSPNLFVRVSRSAILHLNRVKEIRSGRGGQHFAVLNDGEQVPIKRGVREIESRLRSAR